MYKDSVFFQFYNPTLRTIKIHTTMFIFEYSSLLFWTDWGVRPRIERSYLDGSGRRAIVDSSLGWPNGLSVDYEERRLYWVDAQLDRIEAADLNGKNRVQLVDQIPHPFGLAVVGFGKV